MITLSELPVARVFNRHLGLHEDLTAPQLNTVVFIDAGVTDYQSLQAGVILEIATVILSPKEGD